MPECPVTKNVREVICQYGDWLKALGGRTRSPPRGKYGREEAGVDLNWRKERSGQTSHDGVTGDGGDTVHNYSMKEGASGGQVQAPAAVYMQTATEVSDENPRVVDEVEAENLGPVTDSMQTEAVLGAKQADVEKQHTRVVISEPGIQLALNGRPNLNTWNENEVKRANRNEVQVVSRSEEGTEHVPLKENRLVDILDTQVRNDGNKHEVMAIANLAQRCLHSYGKKRPTMMEIMMELEGVQKISPDQPNFEELDYVRNEEMVPWNDISILSRSSLEIGEPSSSFFLPLLSHVD
nr:wall-associated receptor kinase-like 18 [Quercus suber]